ncbi:MAG: replication initiation factor domain-containing protein [Comamonas sp.]
MTRPARSTLNRHAGTCSLVLDGNQIKARLIAERFETKVPVHVDWLRFTCLLRNVPAPDPELLNPVGHQSDVEPLSEFEMENGTVEQRAFARFLRMLQRLPDADYAPAVQARELAQSVVNCLGKGFTVNPEIRKGYDFYRHRLSIERGGEECGWVGFLSSSESPRQQAQSKTLHVNLYGSACTFAQSGWRESLAFVIEGVEGSITRCDLALDFFDGLRGGMLRVKADYEAGLCDVGGKRPKCNMVGDWCAGHSRSFYIGSKEAGKQTNVYEKGHQLFGEKDATGWTRIELRYGNKLRVLNPDMLRRPADYFAGASDWHASMLREAQAVASPTPVLCERKLAEQTVEAEVTRNLRWIRDVAAPSLALAFRYLKENTFLDLVTGQGLPGRLRRFTRDEVQNAYGAAFTRTKKAASAGHAFATA